MTTAKPRFKYSIVAFDQLSTKTDTFNAVASFNAFNSAVSTGSFVTVPPNAAKGVTVGVNQAEFAVTPPLGLMIVSQDNKNGPKEVNLLKINNR